MPSPMPSWLPTLVITAACVEAIPENIAAAAIAAAITRVPIFDLLVLVIFTTPEKEKLHTASSPRNGLV